MNDSLRRETRLAWLLLGTVLAVVYSKDFCLFWMIGVGLPWLTGGFLLLIGDARTMTRRLDRAFCFVPVRLATLLLSALLLICVHVFSLSAALFLIVWGGLGVLMLARFGSEGLVRETLLCLAMTGTVVAILSVGMESVLRLPSISRALGTPTEIERWEERYVGIWRHNIFGFRSPYESITRPPGTKRILALGDSFTWGDKVADWRDTWPAQLEKLLVETGGTSGESSRVEVINAAQRGYTTANEAEWLSRLGWQFEPDILVLQYFVNDVFESGPGFEARGSRETFGWQSLLPVRFRVGAARRSALLRFLETRINSLLQMNSDERYESLYEPDAKGWKQMS